jgi:WD40 repeat protein
MRSVMLCWAIPVVVAGGCGGDGVAGPPLPPLEPLPTASELVPEVIPFDSVGGGTLYFHRTHDTLASSGDFIRGFVQLGTETRSITVHRWNGAVSPVTPTVAYVEVEPFCGGSNIFQICKTDVVVRPLNADDRPAVRVSSDQARGRTALKWSPDGRYLYYLEYFFTGSEAYMLVKQSPTANPGDRVAVIRLARRCAWGPYEKPSIAPSGDVVIAWGEISPDGSSCLPRKQLLRWNAASQSLQAIAEFPNHLTVVPDWSPEGSEIALLILDSFLHRAQLRVLKADGSDTRLVLDVSKGPHEDGSICWSRDGSRIVFVYLSDQGRRIWSIRPNGTGLTMITSAKADDGNLSCGR